jgi:hypothetical protein
VSPSHELRRPLCTGIEEARRFFSPDAWDVRSNTVNSQCAWP